MSPPPDPSNLGGASCRFKPPFACLDLGPALLEPRALAGSAAHGAATAFALSLGRWRSSSGCVPAEMAHAG
jgi:hypothetical protein